MFNIDAVVSYGPCELLLSAPSDVIDHVESEINPFFIITRASRLSTIPIARLSVQLQPFPTKELPPHIKEYLDIDTSLYNHLSSKGCRWGDDRNYIIRIDLTETHVRFNKDFNSVELFQPDPKLCVREVIRTIKGLFTPALENLGCIQLHSAGVTGRQKCVLLLGDMWQGKTTLLLELLANFDVAQLTCDTSVLWLGKSGDVEVRGWPSPFSISHGTMADHPQLYQFFPNDRRDMQYKQLWNEGKKTILTSQQVVERYDTHIDPASTSIDLVIFVRFKPEEETDVVPLTQKSTLLSHLHRVYLGSRDPIYHNWHQFHVCSKDQIDKNIEAIAQRLLETTEMYTFTWAPSAVSLMKRIPVLAQLHSELPRILDLKNNGNKF